MDQTNNTRRWIIGISWGVFALLLLITFFSSIRTVDTGAVGVVTNYGRTTGRELSEGFSWVAPWGVDDVTVYDVKTQKDEVQSAAATKDLQDVNGTLVLNYQLNRGEVSKMHKEVGESYKDKLILPALNEVFKSATAKYNAGELITKRAEVKADVYQQLKERLEKYGISVQDVSITNFSFSAAFNQAIEAVQIANQNVARARQELETTKVEAEKQIQAAQGAAEAQRLQQQTLTPALIELKRIEAQMEAIKKWNGNVPQYFGGGNGEIFNIPMR